MKKLLPLALALCLLLAACGKGGKGTAYDPDSATKALVDSGAFSLPLEEVDAALLYDFEGYGMDPGKLTSAKTYTASGYAEQVSVTVWKTEADAKAAATAFGEYLQDLKDTNQNYAPAEVGKLENAIVNQQGTSVLLIVPDDAEAAKQAVERLG